MEPGYDYFDDYDDEGMPRTKRRRDNPKKHHQPAMEDLDPSSETQCYYCGSLTTVAEIFPHMRENHGRPSRNMHGPPRPYQCHVCQATFECEETQKNHRCHNIGKVTRSDDGLFHCQQCTKTSKTKGGLKAHIQAAHTVDRNFPCNQCDFRGKTAPALKKHVRQVHEKVTNYYCPHCNKGFYDKYVMNVHIDGVHNLKKADIKPEVDNATFHCSECDEVFTTARGRASHQASAHFKDSASEVKVTCDKCSLEINFHWREEHDAMDHPSLDKLKSLSCSCYVCSRILEDPKSLSDHMLSDHQTMQPQTYKCSLCAYELTGEAAILKHMGDVHGKLVWTCPHCPYMTKFNSMLQFHISKKHVKSQLGEWFACGVCGQTTRYLDQHLRSRHPELHMACVKCEQKLEGLHDFTEHMMQVHGMSQDEVLELSAGKDREEGFLCPECGKSFQYKHSLKVHINHVHNEVELQFMCDKCDFRTARKETLRRHNEAKHLKSKTYYCDQCGFKNHLKDRVKTHIQMVHEKIKPHKCDSCEMAYGYKRDLKKHKERVHGIPDLRE